MYTKAITEADLVAATLAKLRAAGIPGKSTKVGTELTKTIVGLHMEDWKHDILDYAPESPEHRAAILSSKIVAAILCTKTPDGTLKLKQPGRDPLTKKLRDGLIDEFARDFDFDADALAEAYLKAAYPSYCRNRCTEKEYKYIHSRARHA